MSPRYAETSVAAKARGSFVVSSYARRGRRAHLVAGIAAVWRFGEFSRLQAKTVCDVRLQSAHVCIEVPDGIELCDACALKDFPSAAVVYRLFDEADHLLYVGCTTDLVARLRAHSGGQRPSSFWPLVARWTYEPFPTQLAAYAAEARAIVAERPVFNRDLTEKAKRPGRRRSANLHLLHGAVTS